MNILAGLACLLAGAGQFRAVLPAAAGMAASLCLVSLCYFGIAALCAQLTGSIIALPILFFSVCVASALLDELIIAALSDFAYGYAGNTGGVLCLFSPIMGISRYLRTEGVGSVLQDGVYRVAGYRLSGWGYLLGYAAAGLLLLWPAQALYRRRRLESAGEVVAVNVLRPVFRYILAAGGALVLACFLSWGLNLRARPHGRSRRGGVFRAHAAGRLHRLVGGGDAHAPRASVSSKWAGPGWASASSGRC